MITFRLLSLIGLLVLTTHTEAALLCANKKGAVFFRADGCKGKEKQVSPAEAGLQGPSGLLGPQGLPGEDGEDGDDGEDADTTKLPIAFGVINPDGSVDNATDNVEATFNQAAGAYFITIQDVTFSFSEYAAVVSPISAEFRVATTAVSAGRLAVRVFRASGEAVPENFSFVVFKPE